MLLLFIVFIGLGINAVILHQYVIATMCFVTPFTGAATSLIAKTGMIFAVIIGVLFFLNGYYIQAAISIGILLFNLVVNRTLQG